MVSNTPGHQCMAGQRVLLHDAGIKDKAKGIEEVAYTGKNSVGEVQKLGNLLNCGLPVEC